jgi:Phosphoadenosine phosphosulfate reductase family
MRSAQHQWDPKQQRPELWRLYNARRRKAESVRVFPLSNWTELDVWQYLRQENLPIVPLYLMADQSAVASLDVEVYLRSHEQKDLLHFITCGSVDDGKSTLIGRLLYESQMVFEDQLAALAAESKKMGPAAASSILRCWSMLFQLSASKESPSTFPALPSGDHAANSVPYLRCQKYSRLRRRGSTSHSRRLTARSREPRRRPLAAGRQTRQTSSA